MKSPVELIKLRRTFYSYRNCYEEVHYELLQLHKTKDGLSIPRAIDIEKTMKIVSSFVSLGLLGYGQVVGSPIGDISTLVDEQGATWSVIKLRTICDSSD